MPLPSVNLYLAPGSDFGWSFQLQAEVDGVPDGNPVLFPWARMFLVFNYPGLSSGENDPVLHTDTTSVWEFAMDGSIASVLVPAATADLMPAATAWQLAVLPEQGTSGFSIRAGTVVITS